jgi:CRP/FNR family transcriptional regulator
MNEAARINFEKLKVGCGQCNLHELCFPHGMATEHLDLLDAVVERRRALHKGDYLYRDNDQAVAIYAVRSGSLKTVVESSNGEEQIVGFHMAGELVGLDGFLDDKHRCSCVSLETSSVCEMPVHSLEALCDQLPALQKQMRRIMGKEVVADHAMLLMLGKMSAEEKLASFLLSISRRMEERHWKADDFVLSMPRQDIANYLGLAVETVSRLFAHYQEEGIIEVDRRRIHIRQMQRLQQIQRRNHRLQTGSVNACFYAARREEGRTKSDGIGFERTKCGL